MTPHDFYNWIDKSAATIIRVGGCDPRLVEYFGWDDNGNRLTISTGGTATDICIPENASLQPAVKSGRVVGAQIGEFVIYPLAHMELK